MVKENCLYRVNEKVTNYLDGNLTFESEVGAWATERLFSVDGRSDVNEKVSPLTPCKATDSQQMEIEEFYGKNFWRSLKTNLKAALRTSNTQH